MRLIDADAFKTQLATAAIKEGTISGVKMANKLIQLIDAQPEIQYAPESTETTEIGSDEIFCHWYQCQRCGQDNIMEDTCYCPDCGRKIIW